ncbi:hypothetical protein GCM10010244_84280 [Streptomyces coeruleorubidus]|nr:hypothetical protein GCM10010244_84280 [Streptomyces bellus]
MGTFIRTRLCRFTCTPTPHCSNGFRAAAKARLDDLRPGSDIRALFPQTPTHRDGLEARRVPQRLPDSWFARLEELDTPPSALRRDAAIRLVQMAEDASGRQQPSIWDSVTARRSAPLSFSGSGSATATTPENTVGP